MTSVRLALATLASGFWLLAACVPTPSVLPTPPVAIEVGNMQWQDEEVKRERVPQDNCDGNALISNEVSKSYTINSALQIEGSTEVGAEVGANGDVIVAGVSIGLGAKVATTVGVVYGQSETLDRTVIVSAAPGTRMVHFISHRVEWGLGVAEVEVGGRLHAVPFRLQRDFKLINLGSVPLPCDGSDLIEAAEGVVLQANFDAGVGPPSLPTERATPTPLVDKTATPSITPSTTATNIPTQTSDFSTATASVPAPTATAKPHPTSTATIPVRTQLCTVLAGDLNLRSGPGTEYGDPIGVLAGRTTLIPLGRDQEGRWIEVEIVGQESRGWISSNEQYVICEQQVGSLPLGLIPPTPLPTATLQATPTPVVTNTPVLSLQVSAYASSGASYIVELLGPNAGLGLPIYTDRNYPFINTPAFLAGATYIKTANDDAARREGEFWLTVVVNRPVRVYVAHSIAFAERPNWLADYIDTGTNLSFVDNSGDTPVLRVLYKDYEPGEIVLGANAPASGENHTMYSVMIAAR